MELPEEAGPSTNTRVPTSFQGSACDTCRRRRVKCDGQQPCERCVKSAVQCTYGSITSRMSAVAYARHLEQKVANLQALLQERPQAEIGEQGALAHQEAVQERMMDMFIGVGDDYVYRLPQDSCNVFYGRFGGLNVLRRVGDSFETQVPNPMHPTPGQELLEAFDSSALSPPFGIQARLHAMLPHQARVEELVAQAARTALICHDCIDHQRFSSRFLRLYEYDPEEYTSADKEFLSLLFALVALGRRFIPTTAQNMIAETTDKTQLKGLTYFHASYEITNTIDIHGIDSIRAIICQARYLLSASMMSKAYSHIAMGAAAAVRMGLHINSSALEISFSIEEMLQRRRVFATLNMMDTYLASLLGLPKTLRVHDIEQSLGLPDKAIADQGLSMMSVNPVSPAGESVFCQRINFVLAKVLEARYPTLKSATPTNNDAYEEDFDFVSAQQKEIDNWFEQLPTLPNDFSDVRALHAQLTLRLWHSMAQIVLYRPFLHHLARDSQDTRFSLRGFECGSACVQAAMEAVVVVEAFRTNGILHEGYWLTMYMLGFAASIIVFFANSSTGHATVEESLRAAWKAQEILGQLGRYNVSARRCCNTLTALLNSPRLSSANVG